MKYKIKLFTIALFYSIIISFIANYFTLIKQHPVILLAIIPVFLLINIFAGVFSVKTKNKRIKICYHGVTLLICFYLTLILSILFHISYTIEIIKNDCMNGMTYICSIVWCLAINLITFWNGIICVYLTSTQLGIKLRVLGVVFGMIPILNLIVLFLIIKATASECLFETEKERINKQRFDQKICKTKYPILLVHGVFFRDTKHLNYWGRIPKELETNGATIFYGNHHSASSVEDSATELKTRILHILSETKAEKINIIAHSKGGLDCRYAAYKLGISDKIASLTTINTPHRGCLFADYLLNKIPDEIKTNVANTYNSTLKLLGEENPDFIAAVNNLTDSFCKQLDEELQSPTDIYCQSVGSVMPKASNGSFPLNFSYHLAKHFSGENDGLVSEDSFKWGEKYTLLRPNGKRGISHGDMIDLNRKNIKGFDVREFYVMLVNDLKNRGL